MRDGEWTPLLGVELKGKTLTIVGAGRIGQAVARIAKRGFEMRVVGCRRKGSSAPMPASGDFDLVTDDLADALGQADFVSLLIPGVPANAHFINRERIELMPRHAWLINTARGAVVDEAALYDALVAQRLGGAALDVFDREPYQPVDPSRDLRTLPNVILTPHVGSTTPEANRGMADARSRTSSGPRRNPSRAWICSTRMFSQELRVHSPDCHGEPGCPGPLRSNRALSAMDGCIGRGSRRRSRGKAAASA